MKLLSTDASPFARKVRIVVREKKILTQVQEIVSPPLQNAPELLAANPLAQIPVLETGQAAGALADSVLISHWLEAQYPGGPQLLPPAGSDAYWATRRLEVLGSGLIEMIVKIFLEMRRPEAERSPMWLKRWEENFMRGIEQAEAACPEADVFDMGSLTLAVAGTYCSFRYPHIDWRAVAPRLAALTDACEQRQSFIDTYPQ